MTEPKKPAKPRAPRKTKKPADAVSSAGSPIGIDGNATNEPMRTLNQEYKPDSSTSAPISVEDKSKDSNEGNGDDMAGSTGSPQAISQPTSANFIGKEQQPEKTEATDGSKPPQHSPQPTTSASEKNQGDIAIGPAVADSIRPAESLQSSLPPARARDGETKGQCRERLRQEARTSGMTRRDAISYAGRMVEQVWLPPPEPVIEPIVEEIPDEPEPETSTIVDELPPQVEPIPEVAPPAPPPDLGVSGLGELPESWGNLPANAQLQVEIAWVSANRLRVRSGNGVDLSRAISPAPSYSALSWLETSILFPSKFADISVKATSQQDDEREFIKREKLAIEEIRAILSEMLEAKD